MSSRRASISDLLLEWRPGAAGAATTNPLAALAWGARRAAGSKLLIFYLWLFYVVLVEGGGKALLAWMRAATTLDQAAGSVAAAAAAGSLFSATTADAGYLDMLLASLTRSLWSPTSWFVVFYGVVAGGVIAYLHSPRPAPLLAQLGAGCGAYAGRFLRLVIVGAALFWAVTAAASLAFGPSVAGASIWRSILLFQATVGIFGAVLDYARVRTVVRDSRSMILETWRSAAFFVRNLPRTLALELLLIAITFLTGVVVLTAAGAARGAMPAGELGFVAEQIWVIAMLAIRLTAWGAMLALFQGLTLARLAKAAR